MTQDYHRNALPPGYRVQWYEVKKILGQGGFGITYLAQDTNLDQEVAIKEYLPVELAVREHDSTVQPVTGQSGEKFRWGLTRFIAEAQTLAKFKHPNIVRVLSVFEANSTAYMIMEYERGDSLQSLLTNRKTMDEAELVRLLYPILDGLEQVHAAGFIHRDIKPANIFIREDGSPVLLDFGSARQAMGEQTKTLTTLVSPGYAPFEQYYSKSDEQGPWTDIYGLSATIYRAVCGRVPLDAVDRSKSILDRSQDSFVTLEEIGKGRYSERFLRAVDHGLQFKQADRPQTIAEWKLDFGVEGRLTERQRQQITEVRPAPPAPVSSPDDKPAKNRAGLVLAMAALVAIAGGGYLAYETLGGPSSPTVVARPDPVSPGNVDAPGASVATRPPAAERRIGNPPGGEPASARTPTAAVSVPVAPPVGVETGAPSTIQRPAEAATPKVSRELEQRLNEALELAASKDRELEQLKEKRQLEAEQLKLAQARKNLDEERQRLAEAKRASERQREVEAKRRAEAQRRAQEAAERKLAGQKARLAEQKRLADEERKRLETLALAEQEEERARQAALQQCRAKQSVVVPEPGRTGGFTLFYASLAVGRNNGWGKSWGFYTRQEADQVALSACTQYDQGCRIQVWSNHCIAFATGVDGAAGWAWAESLGQARAKAIGFCEQRTACCNVVDAFCADQLQ